MLNDINSKKGFSLVEIVAAAAIFSVISIIIGGVIVQGLKALQYQEDLESAIMNARNAMNIMSKELRGANNSEQGDYSLATINDDQLIYYSDIDDDGEMERVEYFLDNSSLYKVVTEPGALDDYTGAAATTTISSYVNNQGDAIFIYYDNNYVETAVINDVRLIKIRLLVNVTPGISPDDYEVITDVNLRNLKDNL